MANTTIPLLPPAISLTGNELVEVVQSGVNKRTTVNAIAAGGVSIISQTVRGATFVSTLTLNPPVNDVFLSVGYACTITGYRLYTEGGPGSCVVDVRRSTYAAFPPTSLDSICGANKPEIVAGIAASDFVLTGWTTAVGATDVVGIALESSSTFSMVTLQLFLEKT